MTEERVFTGGCLCGELRYEARDPIDAGYCHCRLCQRSSGAPVLAWATFPTATFSQTKGEPATYSSSDAGRRDFCAGCGTQIAFRDTGTPERIDVNLGSLDDPAAIEPMYHIWLGSRIPWLEIADHLPRYTDEGPDAGAS
ncbi:MAG: GFA family protein [Deltaproteobacteria bacterium]|nr:GFA family protein [Deltaproteobacteria bacterium]MBW2420644.1 GFA family protein [Deltaproteobacteria bacterium]